MKTCQDCEVNISVYSRYCETHSAHRRKERDRNRKRQERLDGQKYAAVKTSQDRQREIKRQWVCEYLSKNPCVDCSESDILVLEFDHLDKSVKRREVSTMLNSTYSLEAIKAEVAKCEVRCANCHKRKTYERFGETYRTRYLASVSTLPPKK